MKTISPKWSKLSTFSFGIDNGKHCYWCEHSLFDNEFQELSCAYPPSVYCDGDRIHGWDGTYCAKTCGYFSLKSRFTDDKNFDEEFGGEE